MTNDQKKMERAFRELAEFGVNACDALNATACSIREGLAEDRASTGIEGQASLTMTDEDWNETLAFLERLAKELSEIGAACRGSAILMACGAVPAEPAAA